MAEHQGASLEIESPVLHTAQSQGPGCCVPTWWAGAHATICFGQPKGDRKFEFDIFSLWTFICTIYGLLK